jgi:hypothetical protein
MTWLTNPYRFGSLGPAGQHRYWRVQMVGNRDGQIGLGEIEMSATPGGANVLGSATVSVSSGAILAALTDNVKFNNVNFWAASYSGGNPSWVKADFGVGNSQEIREVRFWPRNDFLTQAPYVCTILGSDDDATWYLYHVVASESWPASTIKAESFSGVALPTDRANARIWAVDVTANNGSAGNTSAAELIFASTAGGSTLCTGGVAWSNQGGLSASFTVDKLFDGNTGTEWNTPFTAALVGYCFATPPSVAEMRMRSRNGFLTDTPKDFASLWTADGVTWNTTNTYTNNTGWSNNEERAFAVSP